MCDSLCQNALSKPFPIRLPVHPLAPQGPLSADFLAEPSYFLKLTLALGLRFYRLGIPQKNVIDPLGAVAAFLSQ